MVEEMIDHDLRVANQHALLNQHGFDMKLRDTK
jgi:hypothetical protein